MALGSLPTFLAILVGLAGLLSPAAGGSNVLFDVKKEPERFEEWSDSSVIHDALQCLVANSDDPCNPNTEKLADVFSEAAKGAAEQAADVCLEKLQDVEDMVKLSSSSFSPLEKREIRERRRGRRRHRHRHRHRRPYRPYTNDDDDDDDDCDSDVPTYAVVVLQGSDTVTGTIYFASSYSNTRVTGQVSGLSPGQHGFHIHLYGDFSGGCVSAGPHYNPDERNHGGPDDEERHAGDLGNIVADATGVASIDIIDAQIPLCGENSIIGRSVVVHADPDDLGRGGFEDSLSTGHAGARLACGVVGIAPAPAVAA